MFPVDVRPPSPMIALSDVIDIVDWPVCANPPISDPALFRQIKYDAPSVRLPAAWKISRARFGVPFVVPIFVAAPNWPPPAVSSPVEVTVPAVTRPGEVSPPVAVMRPADVSPPAPMIAELAVTDIVFCPV